MQVGMLSYTCFLLLFLLNYENVSMALEKKRFQDDAAKMKNMTLEIKSAIHATLNRIRSMNRIVEMETRFLPMSWRP